MNMVQTRCRSGIMGACKGQCCKRSTWRRVPTSGRDNALRHGRRDAAYSTAGADDGPLHPCQSGCTCAGPCSLPTSVRCACTLLHGAHVRNAACWRRAAAADPQVAVWRCMHPCMVSVSDPKIVSDDPATVLRLANALEADVVLLLSGANAVVCADLIGFVDRQARKLTMTVRHGYC
jgi:hypothetical protein